MKEFFSILGMSGIPPPRTSVLSDNTAVGGSQGSQPQVKISGQEIDVKYNPFSSLAFGLLGATEKA